MAELYAMAKATLDLERERDERTMERLAWQTCRLMNATGNFDKPVTMDDLLGRTKVETPEERRKYLEGIKKAQDKAKRKQKTK